MDTGCQIEQNDGGLYRSLRTPEWAKLWIEEATADGTPKEQILADYAADVARIQDAETRYYRCSPAARETADAELETDPTGEEWESRPDWWAALAAAAERVSGESQS